MKKLLILFLLSLCIVPAQAFAIEDPLAVPNNKYGIHVIDENDLENAAALVNSSGGDWGYVTIVMAEHERNRDKWQNAFDKMKLLHLIPLIRIATHVEGPGWVKPHATDINEWVEFLDSLRWPVQNRYVILFNEPNHAKEWGGHLDPEGYAEIAVQFAEALKARSDHFFILPAGLDAAAPNGYETMDEQQYLRRMLRKEPGLLDLIDGWNSHSYANPGFAGRLTDLGKGSLRTYQWELRYLKSLGLRRRLPVFITETGWPHEEGIPVNPRFYTADEVADMIVQASERIWNDPLIVAITPFVLNYQAYPFSNFSWQKQGEQSFYPQFDSYRSIVKVPGQPLIPTNSPTPSPLPTIVPLSQRVLSSMAEPAEEEPTLLAKIMSSIREWF